MNSKFYKMLLPRICIALIAIFVLVTSLNVHTAGNSQARKTANPPQTNTTSVPQGNKTVEQPPMPLVKPTSKVKPNQQQAPLDNLLMEKLMGGNYNPQLYELAYKTFLVNNDVQSAYQVAFSAITHQPDNLTWRKRLAIVAVWANHHDVALQQWVYLYQNTHSSKAFTEGVKLAKAINDNPALNQLLAAKIRQGDNSPAIWKAYLNTLEKEGLPQIAITKLNQAKDKLPKAFYLRELANLYHNSGRFNAEHKALTQLQQHTGVVESKHALRQSEILYSQGKKKAALQHLIKAKPPVEPQPQTPTPTKQQSKSKPATPPSSPPKQQAQAPATPKSTSLPEKHPEASIDFAPSAAENEKKPPSSFDKMATQSIEAHPKPVPSSSKPSHTVKYWHTYAALAWQNNNHKEALRAYTKLEQLGKLTNEESQRFINLIRDTDPERALLLAMTSSYKFPQEKTFVRYSLELAARLERWRLLARYINQIPTTMRECLRHEAYYRAITAEIWVHLGNPQEALDLFVQALKDLPHSTELKTDYLWFLINQHKTTLLKYALARWQYLLPHSKILWPPYIVGYNRIGKPWYAQRLLDHYAKSIDERQKDPYWLFSFADLLENIQMQPNAQYFRRVSWPIYQNLLAQGQQRSQQKTLLEFAKIASAEFPGDTALYAVTALHHALKSSTSEKLLLSWALAANHYALAQNISQHYASLNIRPPAWAVLNIALRNYDTYKMADLLAKNPQALRLTDSIEAAMATGNYRLAQQLAYQGLKNHAADNVPGFYSLYAEVMLKTANHFDFKQEWKALGPLRGPRTGIGFTYFITPRIAITPYSSFWVTRSNNSSRLINVPELDRETGLAFKIYVPRGDLRIKLGERTALGSFFTAGVAYRYLVTQNLDAEIQLALNEEAEDTPPLAIGGMKDAIRGMLEYHLTPRNIFSAEAEQRFYFTQDHHFLASGQQEVLGYRHKFWLGYPDLSAGVYGRFTQFHPSNDPVRGKARRLVPLGSLPNVNFFIPPGSAQYGFNITIGENYLTDYAIRQAQQFIRGPLGFTNSWRPFITADIFYDTIVKTGYFIHLGIGGGVFGGDHLVIYFSQGTDQNIVGQIDRLIGLSYRIYLD